MSTTHPPIEATYAFGYARGRHAAKEHIAAMDNPFRQGSSAHQGWSDGHYDEQSARNLAIERHSALLWAPCADGGL